MNTTTSREQTEQILGNPFISAPVMFSLQADKANGLHIYHSFLDSRRQKGDTEPRPVPGSIVANPDVIGANAQIIPMGGTCHGVRSQRLLLKASGPQAPAQLKTIDFFPIFQSNFKGIGEGANLGMRVTDGLLPPTVDSASVNSGVSIPLIVGPDSVVMGQIQPSALADLDKLGVDWSSVFNIAKKVLPVVAKSGYEIYQELNKPEQSRNPYQHEVDGIFDTLLAVAKIAVPIAGSVLSAL